MTDRLQQLSEAGVSIWLDDLSRERLETGNLADLVENTHVVGVTTQPVDLPGGAQPGRAVRRADPRARRPSAPTVDQAVRVITTDDVRDACEVHPTGVRRHATASTAGSRSRSPPAWPTTPTRRSPRRPTSGRPSTSPTC